LVACEKPAEPAQKPTFYTWEYLVYTVIGLSGLQNGPVTEAAVMPQAVRG